MVWHGTEKHFDTPMERDLKLRKLDAETETAKNKTHRSHERAKPGLGVENRTKLRFYYCYPINIAIIGRMHAIIKVK